MLVPRARHAEAVADRQGRRRGDDGRRSADRRHAIGPVVSKAQFDKIQGLIEKGIDEGAELVAGGPGRPEGLKQRLLRAPDRLRQRAATT